MLSWLGLQPKNHLWWTPYPISSPITLYQTCSEFRLYSNLLVLGLYHTLKHLIKPTTSCINHWLVQQFTCIWIMDLSYCHWLYWLPHVIINMPTFQIHFMFVPHACDLLGVLNLLYSSCCGMATQKLNCSYECRWNGDLCCGHLLLVTIKMIRHCEWYMCWQMPKIDAPSSLNGEQQIRHSSPFFVKGWCVGHKISLVFFDMVVTHSQLSLGCVATFFSIFGKLSGNISNILGHDVKPCD